MKFGDMAMDEKDLDGQHYIEIKNSKNSLAEVEIIQDNVIIMNVQVAPRDVVRVPVPGPGEFDLRVSWMEKAGDGHYESVGPGSFEVTGHKDIKPKKREQPAGEVKIRSMADMMADLERQEVEAS